MKKRFILSAITLILAIPLLGMADTPSVIFSEIAWMGTSASANDEWMELKNTTGETIDLTGWQIKNKDEKLIINLSGAIEPEGYFLLERTDDTTLTDVPANQIYTGALKNNDESLFLINDNGEIIDQVETWHAGNNENKSTMERDSDDWYTNDGITRNGMDTDGSPINGTPGQRNSCEVETQNIASPDNNELNGDVSDDNELNDDTSEPPVGTQDLASLDDETENNETPPTRRLIISEVMTGSEVNPEKDVFVELYNPGDEEMLLEGWQISGVTSGGKWINVVTDDYHAIQPGGTFVISHYTNSSSSALEVKPQINKSSLEFPKGNIHIRLRDAQEQLADEAEIEIKKEEGIFRSYERKLPITEGDLEESWEQCAEQTNLKEGLEHTFATPNALNSQYAPPNEVTDFGYEWSGNNLILKWIDPEPQPSFLNLYQLNAIGDGWNLIEIIPVGTIPAGTTRELSNDENVGTPHVVSDNEMEDNVSDIPNVGTQDLVSTNNKQWTINDFFIENETAFKITTVNEWENESAGEELWITPKPMIWINEILPDPKRKEAENEFIELWNAGDEEVDLQGWELDDENLEDDKSYYFLNEDQDYVISPDEFMVLYSTETGISLGNLGDGVQLFDDTGTLIDAYFYAPEAEGRSQGRNPENPEEWIPFNHPTPWGKNVEINRPPIPVITLQSDSKYMGVNPTGEESVDPDGDEMTYLWDFGDGVMEEKKNPGKHTYGTEGLKKITLTITDGWGLQASTEITVQVIPAQGKTFAAKMLAMATGGGSDIPIIKSYPNYELINEVMVNPEGKDSEGEWVELFNPTNKTIDLSGWYLDDGEGGSNPFKLPEGTHLPWEGYLVFMDPDLKLSFKNTEDDVRLLAPDKTPKETVHYKEAKEGWTYAKNTQGGFEWTSFVTRNAPNVFPAPAKQYNKGDVMIERVLPNPEGTDKGKEKVVLKNHLNQSVDLEGWSLKDSQGGQYVFTQFILKEKQNHTFDQTVFKLNLNNKDESLSLLDPAGKTIDEVKWKTAANAQWIIKTSSLEDGMTVKVLRVIDGDTVVIELFENPMTVRLLGIDTPETVHPFKPVEYFGKQASDYLKGRLTEQTITLEFDQDKLDKYGRILAYIYLNNTFINAEMVEKGYGYAYTRFPFKYKDTFVNLENIAKENKVGLWVNEDIKTMIEKGQLQSKEEIEDMEKVITPEDENVDSIPDEDEYDILIMNDPSPVGTRDLASDNEDEKYRLCISTDLKIDAILPNNQQGETIEFIRLINTGKTPICLDGWRLDDDLEKGSKPFGIKGGQIAPGAMRTFRKTETKINLNNSNDCASLIDQNGELMDQVCYEKTHKNELFTHLGGDWQPKKRITTTQKSGTAAKKKKLPTPKFGRETILFKQELANSHISGIIQSIQEEEKTIYMELENKKIIPVSYAASGMDIKAMKKLVDINAFLEIQLRQTHQTNELITIHQADGTNETETPKKPITPEAQMAFLFSMVLPGLFGVGKMLG